MVELVNSGAGRRYGSYGLLMEKLGWTPRGKVLLNFNVCG